MSRLVEATFAFCLASSWEAHSSEATASPYFELDVCVYTDRVAKSSAQYAKVQTGRYHQKTCSQAEEGKFAFAFFSLIFKSLLILLTPTFQLVHNVTYCVCLPKKN